MHDVGFLLYQQLTQSPCKTHVQIACAIDIYDRYINAPRRLINSATGRTDQEIIDPTFGKTRAQIKDLLGTTVLMPTRL